MFKISRIGFLMMLVGGLAASDARALMLRMDLNQILQESESVVIGSVVQTSSFWNADRTRIYTRASIRVQEGLKNGVAGDRFQVIVPGGRVGDITEEVTDTPTFTPGDESVFFLRKAAGGGLETAYPPDAGGGDLFEIHGGIQGKRDIVNGKAGGIPLDTIREGARNNRMDLSTPELSDLVVTPEASSGVTITGISPASASAGTDTRITISGSGFGTVVGIPWFTYKNEEIYGSQSWVDSWSETRAVVNVPIFSAAGYPAAAGSGPVSIRTNAGQWSNDFPFTVTFAYGQIKWPESMVSFRVNPAGNSGYLQAVRDAAETWNQVSGIDFELVYDGTTSTTDYQTNGVNEIVWGDIGSSATIGQASIKYRDNVIVECDIKFNTRFQWSSSSSTASGYMDVETVALHELGHWLNLRDLYGDVSGYPSDSLKVMYGYASYGQQKRSLRQEDAAGIRYIYPASTATLNLSVSPVSRSVTGDSGSAGFTVSNTGSGTMNWTASVTSGNSWLWISSGASGSNSGTVTCSFSANPSTSPRTGTIRVSAAGATGSPVEVTVTQAGGVPRVGTDPGLVETFLAADQTVDLVVNTTNSRGDTPVYRWLVFTAVQNGQAWPLYLLTDRGIFDLNQEGLYLPDYRYPYGDGDVAVIARCSMSDLGLSAGDTFLYGYAYMNQAGVIILDNIVVISIQ